MEVGGGGYVDRQDVDFFYCISSASFPELMLLSPSPAQCSPKLISLIKLSLANEMIIN